MKSTRERRHALWHYEGNKINCHHIIVTTMITTTRITIIAIIFLLLVLAFECSGTSPYQSTEKFHSKSKELSRIMVCNTQSNQIFFQ